MRFLNGKISSLALLAWSAATLNSGFNFSSQSSTLKLSGAAAKIILSTPLSNFSGTLNISNISATSIQATTTMDRLTFTEGVLQSSSVGRTYVSATIDPTAGDTIILSSGQTLEAENGSVVESVNVSGAGNGIYGQPTFSTAIVLEDGSADVTLSIQNKLNQNITMNGGTVKLGNDLALQDGIFFAGNGTINLQSKSLTFPAATSSAWTGDLVFLNANDLRLSGFTTLSGTWTFSGDGLMSTVNGGGSVLDLSGGGVITVDTNHSLYLSDVHIKGVGATGGNIVINSGGTLYLSNVVLELDGSYSLSAGTMYVAGNNCTLIAKNTDKFNITSAGVLTIDGVALLYDPLGTAPLTPNPFVTSSGGTISYLNGGTIRSSYGGSGGGGSIEFATPTGTGNEQLPSNHTLNPSATFMFKNEDPGTPKSITLDGQGFFVQFNYTSGKYWTMEPNLTVYLKNILLKDFDPALIDAQGAGAAQSKIVFSDNTTVSLANDLSVSATPLVFNGTGTVLRGNNTLLTLGSSGALVSNYDLTVKNLRLLVTNAGAINGLQDSSAITLQDSEVQMTAAGFAFSTGHLNIKNNVIFAGMDATSTTGTPTFTFSSKGLLTVMSNSIAKLEPDAYFSYNPNTSGDGDDPVVSKRHLVLADPSATFWLNACTVTTGTMGFALDHGRLLVEGRTTFHINSAVGAEVELGSALLVELGAGGILDVDGALKYTSTTYP